MSVTELALPAAPPSTNSGIGGALSGLGGYMTLGLGAKAKPAVYRVNEDGEFAILKDCKDPSQISQRTVTQADFLSSYYLLL